MFNMFTSRASEAAKKAGQAAINGAGSARDKSREAVRENPELAVVASGVSGAIIEEGVRVLLYSHSLQKQIDDLNEQLSVKNDQIRSYQLLFDERGVMLESSRTEVEGYKKALDDRKIIIEQLESKNKELEASLEKEKSRGKSWFSR